MRILVDYRPALRERTGVGEYIHQLTRAYARSYDDDVVVFTSSWKDRPARGLHDEIGARVVDRRIPVKVLNYLWHRWEWPPIERIAGTVDVAHSPHPLLLPSRASAQVVTIHDVYFLEGAHAAGDEIRRDYAALAADHARRAHAIITSTAYGKAQVVGRLGVPPETVHVCAPGAPTWRSLGRRPNRPAGGYVLFVGTLEPRKNIGALLDAYAHLLHRNMPVPDLILAGRQTPGAAEWLRRLSQAPLAGRVRHLGYVPEDQRESLYQSARLLVMPSLDEGFGLPVLEAMSAGVAVVASSRGSLPEVLGNAGALIDPTDMTALADAIDRGVRDERWADEAAEKGLERARGFQWAHAAHALHRAYLDAVERRRAS